MKIQTPDLKPMNSEQNLILASMLERKYGAQLAQRSFHVETFSDAAQIHIKMTLSNSDRSFVYPIEGRILYEDQDMTLEAARDFLVDFMDAYIQEYLMEGEETYLTIDWSNYECDGIELQLKGQIINEKLEKLADNFIAEKEFIH
jgi:hypothetical protein